MSSSGKPPAVELVVQKDTDSNEDNEEEEEEDSNDEGKSLHTKKKKNAYGRLEDIYIYPSIDESDMDQFCTTVGEAKSVQYLQDEYPWVYANAICFWLRNNDDRLTDEVYVPLIKNGEWDKVRYLLDLMLPRAPVLGFLVDSDCPLDIFALCFDATCRGELQCPYCSTSDSPVTRNECEHSDLWKGIEAEDVYEDQNIADLMMERSATECLTLHLNALLKRSVLVDEATKLKCQVILRNSKAEEYDALLARLFP